MDLNMQASISAMRDIAARCTTALTPEDATALDMLQIGYGLAPDVMPVPGQGSYDFNVAVSLDAVPAAVELIACKYGWDAPAVVGAIEIAHDRSSGRPVLIGRENSPVVYIRDIRDLEDRDRACEAFSIAGADEVSMTADGTLRAWWES